MLAAYAVTNNITSLKEQVKIAKDMLLNGYDTDEVETDIVNYEDAVILTANVELNYKDVIIKVVCDIINFKTETKD